MTAPSGGLESGVLVRDLIPQNIYDYSEKEEFNNVNKANDSVKVGPRIEIINISKSFSVHGGSRVQAIQDINLKIAPGEFVSLVGPSGCGKSTLLNIIAGLDKPDSGEVRSYQISGETGAKPQKGNRLLIFQEAALFPWLTVFQNVAYGLKLRKLSKGDYENKVNNYLTLVKLEQFKDSFIHQLSGGMKQRVALARALVMEPEILLMDEPFAALDIKTRKDMYYLLLDLWQKTGKTILFITHNVDEALLLSNRVVVMNSHPGRIKNEYQLDISYPRHLENANLKRIKQEISKEFGDNPEMGIDQGGSVSVKVF